jgi:hypothetical protein
MIPSEQVSVLLKDNMRSYYRINKKKPTWKLLGILNSFHPDTRGFFLNQGAR